MVRNLNPAFLESLPEPVEKLRPQVHELLRVTGAFRDVHRNNARNPKLTQAVNDPRANSDRVHPHRRHHVGGQPRHRRHHTTSCRHRVLHAERL